MARKVKAGNAERPLKGVFSGGKVIYANYKGKEYKAWVNRLGRIRVNGKRYDTPTGAAKAIVGRGTINGWRFWKYKDKTGDLIAISNLRK